MAKRSSNNNSAGRRVYDEKPYDANNSFVKKMATKVTDLIPQRSWISKWFNSPGGNGEVSNEGDNPDEQDVEEETLPPPSKRPRIRMDMTHPPGTFNIQTRGRGLNEKLEYTNEQYPIQDDTINDFLQPSLATRNSGRSFVSSTPAVRTSARNDSSRSDLNTLNHQQQQNNVASNGVDDNSESSESTSGCSSLIPQTNRQESLSNYINYPFAVKRGLNNDKLSFTNHLQSPRSLLFDGRDSASSRRPSYNYSIVSNGNTSALSSPFYSGNTTFGGANAISNFRSASGDGNDFQLRVPKRTSVRVKPSNTATENPSGMSQTAKRILEALEHFSSPISDAKKIPVKMPSTISSRKRTREEDLPAVSHVGLRHLTRELSIPTVPDMLKLRRRQRLQDTTLAARRIVSAQNEPPPNVTINSNMTEYHLRTETDDKKFFGKLRSNAKKKVDVEEPAETVNLSNIPLPITTMPSFNIPLPIPQTKSNVNSMQKRKMLSKYGSFKFSSPVDVSEPTKNLESIHSFKFSEPIDADKKRPKVNFKNTQKSASRSSKSKSGSSPTTNFMWSGSSTAPRPKEKKIEMKKEEPEGVTVASELKSGSVMDILSKKSDESAKIWECNECIIKNNESSEYCIACKARKSDASKTPIESSLIIPEGGSDGQFGTKFKMSNEQWECNSCLVRNPVSETSCLSCMTPRQQKNKSNPISIAAGPPLSIKKDQVKSEGTWECPGCMLKNARSVITCPCCEALQPGLVKAKSKPPLKLKSNTSNDKTWECPSCMVRNNADVSACVCCTTPCPGSSDNTESAPKTSGFGDKFKAPAGAWSCDSCMLQNKADVTKCVACETLKPGASDDAKDKKENSLPFSFGIPPATKFQFGVPKTEEKNANNPSNGVIFGAPSTETVCQNFTFGIPKSGSTQPALGFAFSAPKTSESVPASKDSEISSNTNHGFPFGVPKKDEKDAEKSTTTDKKPTFIFGTPKSENLAEKPASTMFSNPLAVNAENSSAEALQQNLSTEPKKPTFSFGPPVSVAGSAANNIEVSATSPIVSQTFTFSEPKISTSGTPEKPAISFGQTSVASTTASSGFSFPTPKLTDVNQLGPPQKKPMLNFGNAAPATATATFGHSASNAPANNVADKVKTSLFEIKNQDKGQGFAVDKKFPAFGVDAKSIEKPASASIFGNTEKSTFNQASAAPAFGNSANTPAPATPIFGSGSSLFGSNNSSFGTPASTLTPSIFPAMKPAETTTANSTGLFGFGSTNAQSGQQNTGGFSFNANTPAQKSPFPFGNTTPASAQLTPATGFGTPNFGASSASNPTPSTFAFGAPKLDAPPAFGQPPATQLQSIFGNNQAAGAPGQTTPGSSFPSSTPGSSGMFSFGGSTPVTGAPTTTASTGYNFNTGITPATSSGGFNFNPGSSAVNFDPNTKPTFNFTCGSAPTAFNAPAQPPRKIKKAVRRVPKTT